MMTPELTLNEVKKTARTREHRASDFLSKADMESVHKANAKGKKTTFTAIDAYIAEIIARFGYDTYKAWKNGEISEEHMLRYLRAERTREVQQRAIMEAVIVASVAGANHPTKTGGAPQSLKNAIKLIKKEQALTNQGGK